jgi:tetratricopeptide repeat protein
VPVRERVSGAGALETLNVRSNLAFWTGEAGDAAGARDQLAELLPVVKEALGEQHPDTLAVQRQLDHWISKATGRGGTD